MEPTKQDIPNSIASQTTSSPNKIITIEAGYKNELEQEISEAEKKPREQDDNLSAYNPAVPDDEENLEILQSIRGDAIGNTLYSSRFVITTLLKLRDIKDPLEHDESFEKDLEDLWDMTIERDVGLMMLQFDVFEIFMQCILKYSNDGRLIEILVGIMGNMCSVSEQAMEKLCKSEAVIDVLIQLIATDDSGVLIQLMRLFTIVFAKVSSAYIWYKRIVLSSTFADCFCFILTNSCNTSLLLHSLESLNAILAKAAIMSNETGNGDQESENENESVDFLRYILNIKLSESIKQAFLTFHAKETVYTSRCENADDGEVNGDFNESISESVQKAFTVFLNIQEIIFNYAFDIFNETSETELKSCLLVIISTISTPIFVLSENFDYLFNVLEVFEEFFNKSSSLYDENMACYVANIWEILRKLKLRQIKCTDNSNEFDDEIDQLLDQSHNESLNKLFQITHNVLKIMLQKYDEDSLEIILRRLSPLDAFKLLEAFGVTLSSDYEELHVTALHCIQLKTALNL